MSKPDSWWEAATWNKGLSSVLCHDLDGWDGVEAQEGGGLRIQLADSPCCTAETNTRL